MPTFRFPHAESLRLALVSGIVPADVAERPTQGGTDDAGGRWISTAGVPRDSTVALARLGVTVHPPGSGPPPWPLLAWAELVPLKPTAEVSAGRALVLLPDADLAAFVAQLPRQNVRLVGLRLNPDTPTATVVLDRLPAHLAATLADGPWEVFREVRPGVWVEAGFTHALVETLSPTAGHEFLLARDRPWRSWSGVPPLPAESPELGTQARPAALPPLPTHAVDLRLVPQPGPVTAAALWLWTGSRTGLAELLRDTPEALLRKCRVATLAAPDSVSGVTVLHAEPGGAAPVAVAPNLAEFAPHPQCPTLFLPVGTRLTPPLRARTLAEIFDLGPGHLTVLARRGDSWRPVRVPGTAFRNLRDAIDYEVPRGTAFRPAAGAAWAGLPGFVAEAESLPAVETLAHGREPQSGETTGADWLRDLWRKLPRLADWLRPGKPVRFGPPPEAPSEEPAAEAPTDRLHGKLASPLALVMGNEWTARRRDLERRVLADLPRLPPAERVELWGDLAEVYTAFGDTPDAVVCRLNAAWDEPPDRAATAWFQAECRAARVAPQHVTAANLLDAPDSVPMAAVTAAYLASAAGPEAELAALLTRVTEREAELPARGVWLARLGAARLTGGDPLGLAGARDRLFARLRDKGPGLDLDAPAFLRFRGVATGDRLTLARDWLLRVREPVQRWVGKLTSPGRLQWAGLDGEAPRTAAYADLMVAWGLGKLGDRAHAKDLEQAAAKVLHQPVGPGVDPRVHPHLLQRFLDRGRDAQDGRPDADAPPHEAPTGLDALGRYAIDALRAQSRILEPRAGIDPFEARDVLGFLGRDALGDRLVEFLRPKGALHNPDDARRLLAIDEADPTAVTMPRVLFALLEMAPHLDPQLVSAVIPQTLRAIELIPEWVRLGGLSGDPAALTHRYGRRMLLAACHAATLFQLAGSLRAATEHLIDRCDAPDGPTARLFEPVAGPYFRALARLGLRPLAELLVARLRPGTDAGPRDLGLAVGYFAAGQPDEGNAVLDAARDRLFVRGIRDDRERTATAMAYAAALEHAPPRTALGRLEELFLRLDMVTATGATNRYFTLAPLALIDVAIRAVVSEEFTLGPQVRAWLDDDEYLIRRRVTRDLTEALKSL